MHRIEEKWYTTESPLTAQSVCTSHISDSFQSYFHLKVRMWETCCNLNFFFSADWPTISEPGFMHVLLLCWEFWDKSNACFLTCEEVQENRVSWEEAAGGLRNVAVRTPTLISHWYSSCQANIYCSSRWSVLRVAFLSVVSIRIIISVFQVKEDGSKCTSRINFQVTSWNSKESTFIFHFAHLVKWHAWSKIHVFLMVRH